MNELSNVLQALVVEADAGRPAVFCVLLEKRGAAPREPGAAMLVTADGHATGTIGGGAVELAVQRQAVLSLRTGRPARLEYSLDQDCDTDDSSICGGRLTVGVVPIVTAEAAQPFRQALSAVGRGETAQLPIIVEHSEYRLSVEAPPTLLIAGAGHVGQALARFAVDLDFRVIVIDDREDLVTSARLGPGVARRAGDMAAVLGGYPLSPSCYVVIVTRGHRHDRAALEAVIDRRTAYVGMIGSRKKVAAIREGLRLAGHAPENIDRVHMPIGLPIGAETVNEIAISILAELIQARRHATRPVVSGPRELST